MLVLLHTSTKDETVTGIGFDWSTERPCLLMLWVYVAWGAAPSSVRILQFSSQLQVPPAVWLLADAAELSLTACYAESHKLRCLLFWYPKTVETLCQTSVTGLISACSGTLAEILPVMPDLCCTDAFELRLC